MDYELEKLVPVVARLAQRYTAGESTSVTYEKAQQLMEAVLYCIRQAQEAEEASPAPEGGMPAQLAYEAGVRRVKEKVDEALRLYHDTLPGFYAYGNVPLHDTFVKGLREFFRRYDIRFEPQNTILSLDYPVLVDLSGKQGIDKVSAWIRCVALEQTFLHAFEENYVLYSLSRGSGSYQEMPENLCEMVLISVIGHLLSGTPLSKLRLEDGDCLRIKEELLKNGTGAQQRVKDGLGALVCREWEDGEELLSYLTAPACGLLARMSCAARSGALPGWFDAKRPIDLPLHVV